MANLPSLPPEIKHEIITELDPLDVAAVSGTNRVMRGFVGGDGLWARGVYGRILDEPREPFIPPNWNWMDQLVKLVRFRWALGDSGKCRTVQGKVKRFDDVYEFLTTLLHTSTSIPSHSRNIDLLSHYFSSPQNKEAFLCRSTLFSRASQPGHTHPVTSLEIARKSAKMHCLYGVPIESPMRTHYQNTYPYAISVVYDLRRYTEENFWGPFLGDGRGSVDWERVEAVMIVLGHNLRLFVEAGTRNAFRGVWREPWVGASPGSFCPVSVTGLDTPAPPVNPNDPYNIEGSWMRVVCFLDYHDLFAYNFTTTDLPLTTPRPPLNTTEAIRLIIMELHITSITSDPSHPLYPIVKFVGISRSMHTSFDPNANSNIRGEVRMTHENEVRWTTYSVYSGQERWKSEGIQVGGPGSQRGVFGHWFDKDFDEHGPAGPTAFWKISNEIAGDGGEGDEGDDGDGEDGFWRDGDEEEGDGEVEVEVLVLGE